MNRRLTLTQVFAAVGVVSTALALQAPAVIALRWGLTHRLEVIAIGVVLALVGLVVLSLRPFKQPESWDR